MKLLTTTALLLFGFLLSAQYNYGLEVEQQDVKIEGKLNIVDGGTSVFIGKDAGFFDDGTDNNSVSIGYKAGYSNTNGPSNTILGYLAGYKNNAGANVFIGFQTGFYNTTGHSNVMVGSSSGLQNKSGFGNVFLGQQTGYLSEEGSGNVFLGFLAGSENISGDNNVYLGIYAGKESKGSNNVFIGSRAGYNEAGSNKLYIENSFFDIPLIYGEFDNDLLRINGTLHISETAKLVPQSNQPTCGTNDMGTMYVDTGGVLYFCNGTMWKTVQLN